MPNTPLFSLIVPTRNRPRQLQCFLDSLKAAADRPNQIEVLLVIDSDDPDSLQVNCEGLDLRRVVVAPGLTMGALNMAGYEASTGRYLMLLNDDVIARTPGWDTHVRKCFESVGDDILLVHVNDHVFEQALCTFPIVSRRFCEMAGGICPRDYVRYRIDDHIEDVFNLLGVLGERRSVYLPDVVFEHANFVENPAGVRQYFADDQILAADAPRFEALLDSRKELALRLRRCIENHRLKAEQSLWRNRLEGVTVSSALRVPERLRVVSEAGASSDSVTIAVLTADTRREECRACLDSIRTHTRYRELIVIEDRDAATGRIRAMNHLLRTTESDYLVFVEEDALVAPGWLDMMLQSLTPRVAMVAPLHASRHERGAWGGVAFHPDRSGHLGSIAAASEKPRRALGTCGATFLLDLSKCRRLFFNETLEAYFHDIDFGLQLWEAGHEVICAPTVVTHLADGSPSYGGRLDRTAFENDRQLFAARWFESGRFEELRNGIWSRHPELKRLLEFDAALATLLDVEATESPAAFHQRAHAILKTLEDVPIFRHAALQRASALMESASVEQSREKWNWLRGLCGEPVVVDEDYQGHRITLCGLQFFATPMRDEDFDLERYRRGEYRIVFVAESLEILKQRIQHGLLDPLADAAAPTGLNGLARGFGNKMAKVRACVEEVGMKGFARIVCHKTAKGLSRLWRGAGGNGSAVGKLRQE